MPLKTVTGERATLTKGRGATLNPEGRFESLRRESFDDGWDVPLAEEPTRPRTTVTPERAKSIISRNESPDIPFTFSINPYRGCEHGCIYCYARPSHAYLELSPGLDFETRLFAKVTPLSCYARNWPNPTIVASRSPLVRIPIPINPLNGSGRSRAKYWRC